MVIMIFMVAIFLFDFANVRGCPKTRFQHSAVSGQINQQNLLPYQLLSTGAPSGCVNLATVGTRLHPGGGVGPNNRREKKIWANDDSPLQENTPVGWTPGIAPAQQEGRNSA